MYLVIGAWCAFPKGAAAARQARAVHGSRIIADDRFAVVAPEEVATSEASAWMVHKDIDAPEFVHVLLGMA